ncbi:3-hydroxyacyl-[acyl-carrier-protein] dehydratase, mitochondrial-like isoform X2 [Malania oleifera]|uniref:3-hydroxyacyl-[acyl-carrier-protein] dehydratase, mitochondrial-like isoform X2 n=1 Tax=Malania oleifera TaxID=397392 RepID=UPI0025ADAE99|nr:3-hydroxyacyl-[acyl-carrier-protein] dehydratase, mitochondrial-like isoform X2 [Malania oleifera]
MIDNFYMPLGYRALSNNLEPHKLFDLMQAWHVFGEPIGYQVFFRVLIFLPYGETSSTAKHQPGAVYVSQSLHFRQPVYIGDEVVGVVQAINIRENKKRYFTKFSTKCFKNGELIVDGEAMAILSSLAVEQVHSLG